MREDEGKMREDEGKMRKALVEDEGKMRSAILGKHRIPTRHTH